MTLPATDHLSLFDQLRQAAGQELESALGDLLPRLADELRAQVDHSGDLRVEMALTEAALVLRDEIDIRSEVAGATLDECHVRSLQRPDDAAGLQAADFSLLGDVDLAEQLLAGALAQKARESLGEGWPAYLDRLAQVSGLPAQDDRSPLGAQALALAIVSALRPYATETMTSDAVETALLRFGVEPIRQIIAAADRRMVEAGVLSRLPRIVVQPVTRRAAVASVRTARGSAQVLVAAPPAAAPVPGAAPGAGAAPKTEAESLSGAAPQAMPTPRSAAAAEPLASEPEVPGGGAAADPGVAAARRIVGDVKASMVLGEHPIVGQQDPRVAFRQAAALPRVEALERDAIAFAHKVGHAPFSSGARKAFFDNMRASMKASGAPTAQVATLDVVAAMFDYATDSDRIPDPARPLLWRLQMPAVTLACLDSGYLGDEPRSVRRLVEHVAAIATAYPDELNRGSEMYGRLQTVVRAVEVVAHAFQVRSQVLAEQVKREYRRANQGMGTLVSRVSRARNELEANAGRRNRRDYRRRPSRERELEVSARLERLLTDRLRDRRVPDSVAEFLKGVWLRHLRTAILRDGEESPSYQAALKVVDDLLWTLDGKGEAGRQSRNELASRIPETLRILTQGINDIGSRPDEHRAFFDEMFLIHLRRMQKRRRGGQNHGLPLDALAGSGTEDAAGADLPVLETPIAGSPAVRPVPKLKAGTVEPPAPAPERDPSILPPAPPRQTGFEAPPPLSARDGWPALSPEFVNEIDEAVAGPHSETGAGEAAPDKVGGKVDFVDWDHTATGPGTRGNATDDDRAVGTGPAAGNGPAEQPSGAEDDATPAAIPARARPRVAPDPDAQTASELKLRRLIDSTSLDDVPQRAERMDLTAEALGRDLAPGQWLEMITSSRKRILAKVAWINERRSVVLLLQYPDRLILSRHVAALMDRAERRRVFRVR